MSGTIFLLSLLLWAKTPEPSCDLESLWLRIADEIQGVPLQDPTYAKGFQFLASHFDPYSYENYLAWLSAQGLLVDEKERREARKKVSLFRIHPSMVLELSRVLTILLKHAELEHTALRVKDVEVALRPVLSTLKQRKILDYKNNAFMGLVDELRAAAFFVEEGYEILRLRYDFAKAPPLRHLGKQPVGEIDIVMEDPKTQELILVEVKSHLRSSGISKQLERYVGFLKNKEAVIFDHRRKDFRAFDKVFVFSGLRPDESRVKKLQESFPQVEFHKFPENWRRARVFAAIFLLPTFFAVY